MAERLKTPKPKPQAVTDEIRATVSEILRAVETEGEAAVRRYSQRFDNWNPLSFRVSQQEIDDAEAATDDTLKEHIRFA